MEEIKESIQMCRCFNNKLTTPAARAALSVRHGSVSTRDQGTGDFTTHSSRVLDRGTLRLEQP